MNKQIAAQLAVSEITVKVHGNLTRKMGARSVAELVRMADALTIVQHLGAAASRSGSIYPGCVVFASATFRVETQESSVGRSPEILRAPSFTVGSVIPDHSH
jgi:hypothetical protein